MSKKTRKHNKNIHDAAMGELLTMIKYKSSWYKKTCTVIGKYYASTRRCNKCGFVVGEKIPTNIRKWKCPECGAILDRDINASMNIREEGLRIRQNA